MRRAPDSLALIQGGRHLTYAELDQRSNTLARQLRTLGAGPDRLVGVCMERSIELVIALLAIIKAGAAYLPCDPDYPAERLRMVFEDSSLSILLIAPGAPQRLDGVLKSLGDTAPLCIPVGDVADESRASCKDATGFSSGLTSEHLAYIIYTSGSTGRPKGVQITHSGLLNLVRWHQRAFAVTASDQAMLIASPAFDASVWEIWPYLAAGASIAIPDSTIRSDPARLRAWIAATGSTIWCVPTPLAEALLGLAWPADLRLHTMLTGGDRLTRRPTGDLPFDLINNYGPTESTVVATSSQVARIGLEERAPAIGRPIDQITVYLLDERLWPVPVGEPGEIYIGGAGVARGYLNHPRLTAERFLPDHLGTTPGARLYRTGDLARWRPDGRLEFISRIDTQVKIRGFRIELGEIESTLATHPAVQACVVATVEFRPGRPELVAYLVPAKGLNAAAGALNGELRDFLSTQLPAAMIPATFVLLEALPLTSNGKIERQALPVPERQRGAETMAPRTSLEAMLAKIWEQVLGIAAISIDENFFELGGQSLLATQITAQLSRTLQIEIAPTVIFEYPTIAALASVLGSQTSMRALEPIVLADREQRLPLSCAQQRLWFMDQLVPNSALYSAPMLFSIEGPLQPSVLEQALNEIVRRHEGLRTVFDASHAEPRQIIAAWQPIPFSCRDLQHLPEAERASESARLIAAAARQPFNLRRGPLVRALLLCHSAESFQLLLNIHHIAVDGASISIILREVAALYAAFVTGAASPLTPLALQVADVAVWQHGTAANPDLLAPHRDFWRAQFARAVAPLALPTDRARPSAAAYGGTKRRRPMPANLLSALAALSQRAGSTLFTTMLAGFATLLHRHTGQDDLVIGVASANRPRPEFEDLIGFFVNTLPLRINLAGNPHFSELLDQVRQTTFAAIAHQDLPLEQIVDELAVKRDPDQAPLVQVLFVMEDLDRPAFAAGDVRLAYAGEADSGTAKFDLLLFVETLEAGPTLTVEYRTDLFDAATIDHLLANYITLLAGVVADQTTRLAELPLLSGESQRTLLTTWQGVAGAYPADACLHALVTAQAARTPQVVAVQHGAAHLTYAELEARSNQLAHYLCACGVKPDQLVALCLDRSLDLAISVLAVLKAGAAYMPLDPAYPADRLRLMLGAARPTLLIAHAATAAQLPAHAGPTIMLEDVAGPILAQPITPPLVATTPDHLAYVLYTSGSTGTPKGVAMPHRPLVNLLDWQARTLPGAARTLQFAALSFDVAAQEIFSTWTTGGTLVLVDDAIRRDLAALLVVLDAEQIERLFLPFVALQHLALAASEPGAALPRALRAGSTAGEQLQITPAVGAFMASLGRATLHNQYGPTETHVITAHTLADNPADWPALPPIGVPIANALVRVLDRAGQLAPIGVVGELYLGGVALARGYHEQPALTAERFVPDPWSYGARLYRSGDLGRYRADGSIEYLGRGDQQVKIRGHRVELGEVEAALAQHPQVADAVVVAQVDSADTLRLIAYVIEHSVSATDYRAFLRASLPDYMLPTAVVTLDTLPLTPSGKVDRRALAASVPMAALSAAEAFVAPRTPLEEVLAGIWAEVLGLEQVSINDSFFELGGHSLLATRLIAYIREALEVDLPLRSLFDAPSVAELAEMLLRDPSAGPRLVETARLLLMLANLTDTETDTMLYSAQVGAL
jgi:amino acid adenylation domain-containing protein